MIYKAVLPLKVSIPRSTMKDKTCWLSLNNYRNWHYLVNSNVKKLFSPIYFETWGYKADKLKISYFIERETKISFDTMNYVSVVDKFFLDWLVKNNLLKDDAFKNVSYGALDGANGFKESCARVEIEMDK